MSYLFDDLEKTDAWKLFSLAEKRGRLPHAVAFRIPLKGIAPLLKALYMLMGGAALPGHAGEYPADFCVVGDGEKPPSIKECRKLALEISHRPSLLPRRVGVVCRSDEISLEAANSLLKIAEEPPEGSMLVFLHSQGPLLPTLESRVWSLNLTHDTKKEGALRHFSEKEKETFFLETLYNKGILTKPLFEDMLYLATKEDYSVAEVFSRIW